MTPRDAAIQAIRRAQDSLDSALRELNLNRSALALFDCAKALEAAGQAHYHIAREADR
jgi:HEPN domain-containing protein